MKPWAAFIFIGMCFASDFRPWGAGEISNIIERIIKIESGGDPTCVNTNEWSTGLMQVTKIARDEFNAWTGKNYNYWTMRDPVSNREVGSYLFTNILLRYRCNWNVVQAVGGYNVGISNIILGIYPEDYCRTVVPWYWKMYIERYHVVGRWPDRTSGASIVRLADEHGRAPRIGL